MWPSSPAQPSARLCNFATGKAVPLPTHKAWLKSNIVPILRRNAQCVVEIIGMASRLGSATRNDRLAQDRADAVKAFIQDEVQQSLQNVQTASQGERASGGGPNDDDGYYRAVLVHLRLGPVPPPEPPSHESVRQAIIKAHNIIERSTWGALPPKKALDPDWDYDSIVIHHSGNHGRKNPKEIEAEHRGRKGYDDVGYHYLLHPDGRIFEGRSILHKGSHVAKANSHKIGILMMGDYDEQWWDDDDELTHAHLQKLKDLIATLKRHFTGMKYLGGHLEFAAAQGDERTCPGSLLRAEMDGLRADAGLSAPPQ
jgi:hypothetical protein